MALPTDPKERKKIPMATGLLDYFPDALAAVAEVSRVGNEQHNPGQPLHWDKTKSTDHADCIIRHLRDRGKRDTDEIRHSAKVAWRALALLQTEIEAELPSNQVEFIRLVGEKKAQALSKIRLPEDLCPAQPASASDPMIIGDLRTFKRELLTDLHDLVESLAVQREQLDKEEEFVVSASRLFGISPEEVREMYFGLKAGDCSCQNKK